MGTWCRSCMRSCVWHYCLLWSGHTLLFFNDIELIGMAAMSWITEEISTSSPCKWLRLYFYKPVKRKMIKRAQDDLQWLEWIHNLKIITQNLDKYFSIIIWAFCISGFNILLHRKKEGRERRGIHVLVKVCKFLRKRSAYLQQTVRTYGPINIRCLRQSGETTCGL